MAAVRAAAPRARLIVDANEALSFEDLRRLAPSSPSWMSKLLEQPLPAGGDDELAGYESPVPLCADESLLHTRAELAGLRRSLRPDQHKARQDGPGLTEALQRLPRRRGRAAWA